MKNHLQQPKTSGGDAIKFFPEHLCSISLTECMSKPTLEHQTCILILDHCLEDLFQQNNAFAKKAVGPVCQGISFILVQLRIDWNTVLAPMFTLNFMKIQIFQCKKHYVQYKHSISWFGLQIKNIKGSRPFFYPRKFLALKDI